MVTPMGIPLNLNWPDLHLLMSVTAKRVCWETHSFVAQQAMVFCVSIFLWFRRIIQAGKKMNQQRTGAQGGMETSFGFQDVSDGEKQTRVNDVFHRVAKR